MKILFKEDNPELFRKYWIDFYDKNITSYRYNIDFLDYYFKYNNIVVDKSFVVEKEGSCIGICFIPICGKENNYSIGLNGSYSISPLAIDEKIEYFIFNKIKEISDEYKINKIDFFIDPLISIYKKEYQFNYLKKYDFIEKNSLDCIINLSIEINILWKNLRKSYKSLINNILNNPEFEFIIVNKDNPDYSVHEGYRLLHNKIAGGNSRKKELFDKQFELLENSMATLIAIKFQNEFIGYNYFFHSNKTVTYATGVSEKTYTEKGLSISHAILWKAILYFKNLDFDYLQFGQPCSFSLISGFDDYCDSKQLNISNFKKGMGGNIIPIYRGTRYLNKDIFEDEIMKFIDIYKKNLKENHE